jgi:hypothetical protein
MWAVGDDELKVGVVPFSTDALGAAYGFELLNTGAVRNVRISEHRAETSAQQYIGTAKGAQGFAIVVADPMYFVNVTRYAPDSATDRKMNLTYLRAAVTPTVGEWDLGVGVQSWSGTEAEHNGTAHADYKAFAFDAQAQGAVAGMPLGVYFTHASAPKSGTTANAFNAGIDGDIKATAILAELGVLPGMVTVQLGYRKADTGETVDSKDDAITIGGTYQYTQNIQLQVMHSTRSKAGAVGRYDGSQEAGSSLTTFMLSAGL